MDIHRCRFVQHPAAPINAVAFSHPHLPTTNKASKTTSVRLALGRANGDIEIWNPLNSFWHQELVIHGGKDRSIDALVWLTGHSEEQETGKIIHGRSRLFSIGHTTTVTEWDLENARAKEHASGQHGVIWCLGAQPISLSAPASQKLIGGTDDGSLVLYSTDDDELRFQRMFRAHSKSVRVVSIAFQSRHLAVVGCSDSTIRVIDIRNGSVKKQMTLGRDLAGGAKDIIVWCLKCLNNGDIVSGDSTGQICIWDGKTYTQAQRIQGHDQDVLSLATTADGTAIFSGGMDRRTVSYRETPGRPTRWSKVGQRRYHEHDVAAMASFEGHGMSVVVTGGPDAAPIVIPLRKLGVEHHRTLSHLPQSIPLCSAPRARLLISWWEREVRIWKLQRNLVEMIDGAETEAGIQQNRKLFGHILIKGESNITSADISSDGSLLVVSTVSEIKAFQLQQPVSHQDKLRISTIKLPAAMRSRGATKVAISPDRQWISMAYGAGRISIAKVEAVGLPSDSKLSIGSKLHDLDRLKRDIPKHRQLGGLGSYDRQIAQIAFSADSNVLAVSDLAGYIDTWISPSTGNHEQDRTTSNGQDDAFSSSSSSSSSSGESDDEEISSNAASRWIRNPNAKLIPKLPAAALVLSFSPEVPGADAGNDYKLLAVTTTSEIFAFHPLRGRLTPWSRWLKRSKLPVEYRNVRDLAKGVIWQGSRCWIYGASYLFMIDTSIGPDDPQANALVSFDSTESAKRKRGSDSGAGNKMTLGVQEPQNISIEMEGELGTKMVDIEMEDMEDRPYSSAGEDDDDSDASDLPAMQESIETTERRGTKTQQRRWWSTFKYRPILGIVRLETPEAASGDQRNGGDHYEPLEVALVERPRWDLDLPPRYAADDE